MLVLKILKSKQKLLLLSSFLVFFILIWSLFLGLFICYDDDREENDKENDDIDENSDDCIDGEEDCFDDEDDNAETDEDHETRMIENIFEDEFEEEGDLAEDEIETDNDVQKDLNENSMKRRLRKRN